MCVFSVHSLIKDPPFSRLNLISCRNVLIYLGAEFQTRVMQMFHNALTPAGFLFLGPSESASRDGKLFDVLNKKHRILKRRGGRLTLPAAFPSGAGASSRTPPSANRNTPEADFIAKSASRLMERHAPAYFVIDRTHEIIRFSGSETGPYVEPSESAASLNLFNILRMDLRSEVRAALQEAMIAQKPVVNDRLSVTIDGRRRDVVLIVEPFPDIGEKAKFCVIACRERDRPLADSLGPQVLDAMSQDTRALERELRGLRAQLQTARDEMEAYIEDNRSATEEYQTVNEELQSSNEELETAKEEMQSVNEELQIVNNKSQTKSEATAQANSDLQNLLDSTQIATIFLDDELRIKNFTPATTDLFPIRSSDRVAL